MINLSHRFKLYADDGKLIVYHGTDREDDDMQYGINMIVKWRETWYMGPSPEKYKIINLGN